MKKKVKGIVLNDYYFALIYLILSFLMTTTLNNNVINFMIKISLLWGGGICAYNLYI